MIELLVVILIISILLSFILPALVECRDSARRIQCCNNLKQIILAVHNYESQYRVIPPGVVNPSGPIRSVPEDYHIGWVVQLLPFMEQNGLAQTIDLGLSAYSPQNGGGRRVKVNSLECPADASALPTGSSHYAGCHHDVEAPIDADNHGVFFLNSRIRQADIVDGHGFTIFVGEKLGEATDLGWMSGTRATLRNTGTPINAKVDPEALVDPLYVGGFGSRHRGGANFAFGDGAVHFLRDTIDPSVFRLLGNRDDGELIDGRDF